MGFDYTHWKNQVEKRRPEEFFTLLGIRFKRDRGHKYILETYCPEEYHWPLPGGLICYSDYTIRCRECDWNGHLISLILETIWEGDKDMIEDSDIQEVFDTLPATPDPRQLKLFYSKNFPSIRV